MATKKSTKLVTKKVVVKKAVVKKAVVKKAVVKKAVIKKVAVKNKTKADSSLAQKFVKKSTMNQEYKIIFSIHARAIKQEDYSGSNFSEWFDSGTDDYSLAKPDDYFKKGEFYEVIWSNNQSIKPNIDLAERIFRNINMWASDFEAFFLPDSKITLLDNNDKILKLFEF